MASKSEVLKKINQTYQEKKQETSSTYSIEDNTSVRDLMLKKLTQEQKKQKSVKYEEVPEKEQSSDSTSDHYTMPQQSNPLKSQESFEINELLELSNKHATEIQELQFQLKKLQNKLNEGQPYLKVINAHFGTISPEELNSILNDLKSNEEQVDVNSMVKKSEKSIISKLDAMTSILNHSQQLKSIEDKLNQPQTNKNDNFALELQEGINKLEELCLNDSKKTVLLTNQIVPQLALQLKNQLTDSITTTHVVPLEHKLKDMHIELNAANKNRDYYKAQVSKLTRVMTSSLMGSFEVSQDYDVLIQDIHNEVKNAFKENDLPSDWLVNWIGKTTPDEAAQSVAVMSDMLVELFASPEPQLDFKANQDTIIKVPLYHLLKALLLKIYILQSSKSSKPVVQMNENEMMEMVQKKIQVLQESVNRKSNLLSHLNNKIE